MEKSVARNELIEKRVIYCTLLFGGILAFYPYLVNYVNQGSQVQPYWDWMEMYMEIPRSMGFTLATVYKTLILLITGATVWVAYMSVYFCIENKTLAAFVAAIYVVMPYRLQVVYGEGDVAEMVAMIFWPLIVGGVCRFIKERKGYIMLACGIVVVAIVGFGKGSVRTVMNVRLLAGVVIVFVIAYAMRYLKLRIQPKTFLMMWIVAGILCVYIAVYFVNSIAFETRPIWLTYMNATKELSGRCI